MVIPSTKPYIPEADIKPLLKDMEKILRSGRLLNGPYLRAFEEAFAKQAGTRYAIGVNSATSALQTILQFFDVHGREVITPTNTFIATSNAVLYAGGSPVLADMHPETLCLDIEDVRRRITKKTKGVVLVHLNGLITPHIKEIKKLCKKHNLFLIEDASHAHGARAYGRMAGSWGDAAAFSCLATKPMTTGGVGGVITTNDKKLAAFAHSLRFHGEDKTRGLQDRLGNNWSLTEFQAALGLSQTRRLREIVKKRMAVASAYDKAFSKLPGVKVFKVGPLLASRSDLRGFLNSYYKYPLLLKSAKERTRMATLLKKKGIGTGGIYWPPCHLQPIYKKLFKFKKGDFPVAEDILSRTIALPMYTGMKREEIGHVVQEVKKALVRQ